MSPRPSDTLEVHVSFEVNRLAPLYLIDAYELLVSTVPERKPATTESTPPSGRLVSAPEETAG
jgi:hypothetical protein